jgi:two-component sensor histidine kinase
MWFMGEDFRSVFFGDVTNHIIISLIAIALCFAMLYVIYRLLSEEKTDAIKEVWLHYAFVISVFQLVATVFVSFCPLDGTRTDNAFLIMLVAIAFLIMSLMVINFFTEICAAYKREKQIYTLRCDYSAVKEQLAVQFQTSKRLKKIRHDIKNHLMNAAMLIDNGETDKARELLQEISDSADKLQPVLSQSTGNSLIDAIVAYKSAVCESRDIKFVYQLELLPEIKMSLSDISSVLSNLLDNAIEAAEKAETATVNVRIFTYKNYITIIVKNTFSRLFKENTGKLSSKKDDRESHGLGMEIINEICGQNGGVYKYRTDGIWFTSSVLMKI